jgi:hypothetical protein
MMLSVPAVRFHFPRQLRRDQWHELGESSHTDVVVQSFLSVRANVTGLRNPVSQQEFRNINLTKFSHTGKVTRHNETRNLISNAVVLLL